jgi:Zn-dependent protease
LVFGIGLILLLFVHEMGHVLEAKRQGLPVSVPVFIPFMGALITMKRMPSDAWREARLAIGGPLLGSAGALALYVVALAYDSQQLKALAFLGFLINLFNLLPVLPLDGGRISAALHPAMWFVGLLGLLALVLYEPNPILIVILLLAGSELWGRWRTRRTPQMRAYYRVRPHQRLLMACCTSVSPLRSCSACTRRTFRTHSRSRNHHGRCAAEASVNGEGIPERPASRRPPWARSFFRRFVR